MLTFWFEKKNVTIKIDLFIWYILIVHHFSVSGATQKLSIFRFKKKHTLGLMCKQIYKSEVIFDTENKIDDFNGFELPYTVDRMILMIFFVFSLDKKSM